MTSQGRLFYQSESKLKFPFHFFEPLPWTIVTHLIAFYCFKNHSTVLPSSENLCNNIFSCFVFSGHLNPKFLDYESHNPPYSFYAVSSHASPSAFQFSFSFCPLGRSKYMHETHAHRYAFITACYIPSRISLYLATAGFQSVIL